MLSTAISREISSEFLNIWKKWFIFRQINLSLFPLSVSVFLCSVRQALCDLREIRNRSIVIGTRVLVNVHLRFHGGNSQASSVCRFGFTPVIIDPHC